MCWMCDKRVILHRLATFITMVTLTRWHSTSAQKIPTYYLDDYCSRVLDMTMANVKSGRIMLHRPGQNPIYPSCQMLIKAPTNKRLSFKFHFFDIETPLGCTQNFLRIFEDHQRQFPITDKLCNSGKTPDKPYITNGDEAVVWLNKEHYLLDQVELVFTAFSFSPCVGGDYQCHNDHCISSDLYCNDEYDNCGDESDICFLKHGTVVGIIVAVVVLMVILAILLALYMFRRQRKIRREKLADILSNNQDRKSQLSFVSDGKSSTLRKQPSILSHGSGSMMRYPGFRTVAFTGTKAHSLGYQPLMFTASPMSSQYSSLTRDGTVLGSNLGEKARSSIKSKPSKTSIATSEPLPKTSVRKRPSGELRAPFYFDKDGYFSDSSASQTNSVDNKYERRSSLDATDGKKKKKFMGRNKKKSKKGKDEKSQHSGDNGRLNTESKDKKERSGLDQMPEDVYIDGRRLVNTVNVPEIRVSRAYDSNERNYKDQHSSKDNYDNRSGKNYGSDNISAGTPSKSADGLNPLMERRKAGREEPSQSEMRALKIQPRIVTADAEVHRPRGNSEISGLASNDNDSVAFETIVETQSLGHDTVDGGTQSPTHISVLTLPEKHPQQTQQEGMSPVSLNDNDNIETVVEDSPSFNTADNKIRAPIHISALTLPDMSIYGRANPTARESSSSNSNDEMENYPRTNFQLAGQTLSPTTSPSQIPDSPFNRTGRPLTPTRQMGLSARHADGSPYQLHKVSQKSVKKQLKQHPEDRANVTDHVISFRSYASPVHSLERAGLFRNNSRRSTNYSDTN